MARREYDLLLRCSEKDCNETQWYVYKTKKEYQEGYKRHNPWKCLRHSDPDKILSKENRIITFELINGKSKKYPDLKHLFFGESGFVHGYNWRAYAEDFPEDTKIIGRIEVVLPENKS